MTAGRASFDAFAARWDIPRLLFVISAGVSLQVLILLTLSGGDPVDALCYWLTDPAHPYRTTEFQFGYSPVVAQIMAPLFDLPFEVFALLLRIIEVASLVFLTGPLAGALIFTTPVASEVNAANINLLIAVVMVLGFRWPVLWVIPLLTKPTMGVGLLWFLWRREWRKALIPIAVAGALALGSFLFDPRVWFEYVAWLRATDQDGGWPYPYPIWARLPISIALVIWGARTNRPWAVALASAFALPRLYYQSPAILIAVVPLIPWLGRHVVPWARRIAHIDEMYPERPRAPSAAGS
jgi:glycosyl transferase family 87